MRIYPRPILATLALLCWIATAFAQNGDVILEGYIFEDNNSGYLNEVKVSVLDAETSLLYGTPVTNRDGYFAVEVPRDRDFQIRATKPVFETAEGVATSKNLTDDQEKIFIKLPMARAPGYLLEVTLAEERANEDVDEVNAIANSLIEVYNNTKDTSILELKEHPSPYFSFPLEQGNHYTLLIRSPGYFTKRIESFVNVDGCILCMDGVSEIGPGVSDNLAYGNDVGTLLANIDLKPLRVDSAIALENIYYDYNKADIRPDAQFELDKVVELLKVNPSIVVELGSHTDSRGYARYNRELSQKRAQSAVDYILAKGVSESRLTARGYGESKPVNTCIDDVECDEEEHARNRRTELKITGFTNDPFLGKPLVDIIADENLDALLEEVLAQGEVQVPEGGEYVAGTPYQGPADATTSADAALENLKGDLSKNKASIDPASPEATASEQPRSGTVRRLGTTDDETLSASVEENPSPKPATGKVLKVIVPETSISNAKPLTLPTGAKFSGYRVLVFQSPVSLADENGELFFKFGTLREDELKDGTFGYMSGSFNSEPEARSYLSDVKSLFPEARLLRYVNGFIIENVK